MDVVDCGAALPRYMGMELTWMFMDRYGLGVVLACSHPALWIPAYAGMTVHPALPLWIADQVKSSMTGHDETVLE